LKACRQFLKGIVMLLGNAQITMIAVGQMFLIAECDEKSRK
jgi:hypothetical protein